MVHATDASWLSWRAAHVHNTCIGVHRALKSLDHMVGRQRTLQTAPPGSSHLLPFCYMAVTWYGLLSSCCSKPEIKAWICRWWLPNSGDPSLEHEEVFVDLTLEPLFEQPSLPARRALQAQEPSPVCPQSKHTPMFAKWINGVFDALREFDVACQ